MPVGVTQCLPDLPFLSPVTVSFAIHFTVPATDLVTSLLHLRIYLLLSSLLSVFSLISVSSSLSGIG